MRQFCPVFLPTDQTHLTAILSVHIPTKLHITDMFTMTLGHDRFLFYFTSRASATFMLHAVERSIGTYRDYRDYNVNIICIEIAGGDYQEYHFGLPFFFLIICNFH